MSFQQRKASRGAGLLPNDVLSSTMKRNSHDGQNVAKANSRRKELLHRREAPLETPTDLTSEATRDISAAMNAILADVFALYVKTKNFHWHMSGHHFRDYHLLLDEHADQLFAMTDAIAERWRPNACSASAKSQVSSSSARRRTARTDSRIRRRTIARSGAFPQVFGQSASNSTILNFDWMEVSTASFGRASAGSVNWQQMCCIMNPGRCSRAYGNACKSARQELRDRQRELFAGLSHGWKDSTHG